MRSCYASRFRKSNPREQGNELRSLGQDGHIVECDLRRDRRRGFLALSPVVRSYALCGSQARAEFRVGRHGNGRVEVPLKKMYEIRKRNVDMAE